MFGDKRVITFTEDEHNLLINGFNEFRNKLLEADELTEDVDKLLMKILDAPTQKEKRRLDRESR